MSLLDPTQPVSRAVRDLLSAYLDSAADACRRLKDPADGEAVHDFRVALRRLRSLARAYKPYLQDYLPGKLRRRARALASSTGLARDTEVQLAWLEGQHEQVGSPERPGILWMTHRLESRLDQEYRGIRKRLPGRFKRLEKQIAPHLAAEPDDDAPALGEVAANLMLSIGEEFGAHLEQAHDRSDEDEIHRARITAKRLRYLLEPLAGNLENGKALVQELKALQQIMGEIHDTQVLAAELSQAAAEAGAEHLQKLVALRLRCSAGDPELDAEHLASPGPGLVHLAAALRARKRDLTARLMQGMDEGDLARFLEHLRAAAKTLREMS